MAIAIVFLCKNAVEAIKVFENTKKKSKNSYLEGESNPNLLCEWQIS